VHRCRLAFALAAFLFGHVLLAEQQPAPATPTPPPASQVPTFRSSAEAVQMSVIVTDASGRPVAGLTEDDFEILENRQPRPITTFSAIDIPIESPAPDQPESDVLGNDGPQGRVYVIALDDMSAETALRARHILRSFLDRYFGPNDSAAIILTTQGLSGTGQEFTRSPRLLRAALERFTGGSTTGGGGRGGQWTREKNFMGSFLSLVKVMAALPVPRKTLVLVSSSIPGDADLLRTARTSRIGRMFSDVNPEFLEAVSIATRNNVSVYPIDPAGLNTATAEPGAFDTTAMDAQWSLAALANITGGFALSNSNNFEAAFERLVRENSTYYVLGFNSGEEGSGRFASVEVRVKRPDLQVRTIEGYIPEFKAPPPVRRPQTVLAAAWDAVASPLTSSGVNIRMAAAPYRTSGKNANVAITLEIATKGLGLVEREGVYRGELELLFAVTDSKSRKRFPIMRHRATLALKPETYANVSQRSLRVVSQLSLPKGRYQVRASAGGEVVAGSIVYDVEVPDFGDDFSMSGVSVTSEDARRTLTVQPPGRFDIKFPGPPTTVREFSRDDVLTLFAETYENRKKKHQVSFVVELRDTSGKVIGKLTTERTSAEKPSGASVHTFAPNLSLQEVPPGSYVLDIQAKSSLESKPITRSIPITVR
jgi:VWFA-related protein